MLKCLALVSLIPVLCSASAASAQEQSGAPVIRTAVYEFHVKKPDGDGKYTCPVGRLISASVITDAANQVLRFKYTVGGKDAPDGAQADGFRVLLPANAPYTAYVVCGA